MSVRLDADTEGYGSAAGSGICPNGSYWAFTGWVYVTTSGTAIFMLNNSGGTTYFGLAAHSTNQLAFESDLAINDIVALPLNTWIAVYMTSDRGDGQASAGLSQDGVTWSEGNIATRAVAGADHFGIGCYEIAFADPKDQAVGLIRVWSATKASDLPSIAELKADAFSSTALRRLGLWGDWKLRTTTDTTDYSQNGRTLSSSGTPTNFDQPIPKMKRHILG